MLSGYWILKLLNIKPTVGFIFAFITVFLTVLLYYFTFIVYMLLYILAIRVIVRDNIKRLVAGYLSHKPHEIRLVQS